MDKEVYNWNPDVMEYYMKQLHDEIVEHVSGDYATDEDIEDLFKPEIKE